MQGAWEGFVPHKLKLTYKVPPILHVKCEECGEMVLFPKSQLMLTYIKCITISHISSVRSVGRFCSLKSIEAHIYQVPPILHIKCEECGEMALFPKNQLMLTCIKCITISIPLISSVRSVVRCGAIMMREAFFSFRNKA